MINVNEILRQDYLEHDIPLGTLVEVNLDYSDQHGIRAFVCEHTRDCDGTPLYALSIMSNQKDLEFIKTLNNVVYRMMISDCWTEDCLIVVKEKV